MAVPFLGYEEKLREFVFREKASLTIPKSLREKSYTLALDLEVVSTRGNDYLNYKSNPAFSFYGYAVLVLQDHTEIQIPLSQPRQRLYYGRVHEAFVNWFNFYLFFAERDNWKYLFNTRLSRIDSALGISSEPASFLCPSPPVWIELPLREVYVKCPFGTVFRIEIASWQPRPMDFGEGCNYDGKSNQRDGAKDSGLPPNGVQPRKALNKDNPYLGTPPPSSGADLGEFFNGKGGKLDQPNPENQPEDKPATLTEEGYYIEYTYDSCSNLFNRPPVRVGTYISFEPSYSDSFINVISSSLAPDQPCGRTDLLNIRFRIDSTSKGAGSVIGASLYGAINGEVKFGKLPTPSTFDGMPYP